MPTSLTSESNVWSTSPGSAVGFLVPAQAHQHRVQVLDLWRVGSAGFAAGPGLAPLLRVHQEVIAAYSVLEGDENTTITYYADTYGLEPFLASLHGPPSTAAVLAIQPGTNNLVEILWPVSISNWVAETTFNLSAPAWFPAGTSRKEGAVRVMTQPMSGPQRFYRLRELPPLP